MREKHRIDNPACHVVFEARIGVMSALPIEETNTQARTCLTWLTCHLSHGARVVPHAIGDDGIVCRFLEPIHEPVAAPNPWPPQEPHCPAAVRRPLQFELVTYGQHIPRGGDGLVIFMLILPTHPVSRPPEYAPVSAAFMVQRLSVRSAAVLGGARAVRRAVRHDLKGVWSLPADRCGAEGVSLG